MKAVGVCDCCSRKVRSAKTKRRQKEYNRQYYQKNREKILNSRRLIDPIKNKKRNASYYQRNKERIISKMKEYYQQRKQLNPRPRTSYTRTEESREKLRLMAIKQQHRKILEQLGIE